jgi:hypothetical protein
MTLLGKDYDKMEISCGDFVIEENKLFFAVADGVENLHVFQYDPESLSSHDDANVRSTITIRQSTDSKG